MVATRVLFNLVLVTMRHKNIFPLWMERVIRTLDYTGVILGLILGRRFNYGSLLLGCCYVYCTKINKPYSKGNVRVTISSVKV